MVRGRQLAVVGCLLGGLWICQFCQARELVVDPDGRGDYAAIQPAVAAAKAGDVITIRSGLYREAVKFLGKTGTQAKPILIQADPAAPVGSVIIDGSRTAPPEKWKRFTSERYGVRQEHNIWWTAHNPETDCTGDELTQPAAPYNLHKGYYLWDGKARGPTAVARWGTCALFQADRRLELVPTHPKAGKMSDRRHADIEETQSEEYITAGHPKFLKPGQWIWYDDGRTDGPDEDDEPVRHPLELQHKILLRLPEKQSPRNLSYTVRSVGLLFSNSRFITVRGLRVRRVQAGLLAKGGRNIRLQNLIVEEFGGGRKFRPTISGPGVPDIHIYVGGIGIHVRSRSTEIVGALVQNGLGAGIGCGGRNRAPEDLKILYCTVRDIRSHPWGGRLGPRRRRRHKRWEFQQPPDRSQRGEKLFGQRLLA